MIGIFDSGFGGLAIFKDIARLLPEYNYIYLGDSARAPYGCRSQEVIYKFSKDAVDFLFDKGCELIIVACGTASSEALKKLQQEYLPNKYPNRRILGIIRPLAEEAVRTTRFGRVGVVGTTSTIESNSFARELEKANMVSLVNVGVERHIGCSTPLEIHQKACPLLVPLIEGGWIKKPETKMILKKYLRELKQKRVDTLILGCTHYSLLFKDFQRAMGKSCSVLDGGKIVSESLKNYLERHPEIEKKLKKDGKKIFLTTDDAIAFAKLGSRFLGESFEAEQVEL
ncbi:MAG: glutamate racemase [bacterium]